MLSATPARDPAPFEQTSEGTRAPSRDNGRRKRPTVPLDQRKRVRLACETCRRTKSKCDGTQPACTRCAGMGKECSYVNATSAGSPAGSAQDHNRGELLHLMKRALSKLNPEIPTDLDGLRHYCSFDAAGHFVRRSSDEDTSVPRASEVSDDVASRQQDSEPIALGGSPMLEASVTVVNQGKTHFVGKSSYWSFFNSVKHAVADGSDKTVGYEEADCDGSVHQPSMNTFGSDWKTGVIAALPPREIVHFLIKTFFDFAQSNYFYVHPDIMDRKLDAFYQGTHEFEAQSALDSRRSSEFICLLFMVLAIGSQFAEVGAEAEFNDQISSWPDSSSMDFNRIVVPTPAQNPGWRFYEISRRFLPDVISSSSMTSVQVCVLQGIFLPSTTSRDAGYNLLGLALRMAINMGMHRSFGAESLRPLVRELRNRLWWSVYVADRLFSIEIGRPLAINDAEIDAPFPTSIPEWNIPGQEANVEILIAKAKLCRLLGKIVEIVYCKSSTEKGTGIQPQVFRRLEKELKKLRTDLPGHLRLQPQSSRSIAHLALAFEQATTLLTRPYLNCAAANGQMSLLSKEAKKFVTQQALQGVKSALASIAIMSSLRSRSQLCRFSFHDSLYCSAALYVILLVEKQGGLAAIPKPAIHQGILILLYLSKGSESAAAALRYILRAFQSCIGNDSSSRGDDGTEDSDARRDKARRAWKDWMTTAQSPAALTLPSVDGLVHDPSSRLSSYRSNTIGENGRTVTPEACYELANFASQFADSPSLSEELAFEANELQSIWIPDNPGFNVFSRDLAGIPDHTFFGAHHSL